VKLSGKRREEITSLRKLIKLAGEGGDQDLPSYYFRLAELLWEESQYWFFEANRTEGELLKLPKGDARQARLQAEKAEAEGQFKDLQKQAVVLYKAIIAKHPDYPRLDEVLFFLARNLLLRDRTDAEAMKAYRALIQRFPDSPYVPDAWMAFGEYYFEKANKGDRSGNLKKALEAYRKAADYKESSVYGYALYKQGWVQFNLGAYADALDLFRGVVYFGELPTSTIPADRKLALVKEARKDYVRTWPFVGTPEAAFEDFRRVGGEAGAYDMLKSLADLYWTDGKDREAILVYHRLIQERPVSADAPGFQSRIVTMAGRMGRKELAVQQAHVFVKVLGDFEGSPAGQDPKNATATAGARSTAENTSATWRSATTTSGRRPTTRRWPGTPPASTWTTWRSSGGAPRPTRCASSTASCSTPWGASPRRAASTTGWCCRTSRPWRPRRRRRSPARPRPSRASGSATRSRGPSTPTRRRPRRRRRCLPSPTRRSGWPSRPSGSGWCGPTSATCAGRRTASWPPRRPSAPASSTTTTTTTPTPSTSSPGWRSITRPAWRPSTPPTWCWTPTTSWATGGT
jgi:tetratricopeptide (TPR) repeat protein